jgi:hypothetical protein
MANAEILSWQLFNVASLTAKVVGSSRERASLKDVLVKQKQLSWLVKMTALHSNALTNQTSSLTPWVTASFWMIFLATTEKIERADSEKIDMIQNGGEGANSK